MEKLIDIISDYETFISSFDNFRQLQIVLYIKNFLNKNCCIKAASNLFNSKMKITNFINSRNTPSHLNQTSRHLNKSNIEGLTFLHKKESFKSKMGDNFRKNGSCKNIFEDNKKDSNSYRNKNPFDNKKLSFIPKDFRSEHDYFFKPQEKVKYKNIENKIRILEMKNNLQNL